MDTQSKALIALLLACGGQFANASAYRTENPGSAYPPSCITGPLRNLDLSGDKAVRFYSDRIWLETAYKIESDDPYANLGEVQLDMYRVGCAEPNRSVIIAEFSLPPDRGDPRNSQLILPWVEGVTGFDSYPLEFKSEANGWGQSQGQFHHTKKAFGDFTDGWDDARRFSWRFVLDVQPAGGIGDRDAPPFYYNGQFGLEFFRSDGEPFHSLLVPPTEALLEPTGSLPLGGRLSGNWVEEGSADQGFLISVSNAVPPAGMEEIDPERSQLLVFFSWFTFDSRGDMLWLTGSARLGQGASSVSIPIERVSGGQFLGSRQADREVVGTVRLKAVNCNRIRGNFDLDALGLGAGNIRLERLDALEIADYSCRDYRALQTSIYHPESN